MHPTSPPITPHDVVSNPFLFKQVSVDLVTDLPPARGCDSILTIVDQGLTKAAFFLPTNKTASLAEIAKLYHDAVYPNYGIPDAIISDRRLQFVSSFTRDLYSKSGIELKATTAYRPQSNGEAERVNQEIRTYLCMYCTEKPDDWSLYLADAQFAHNSRIHSMHGQTPFYLLHGYEPTAYPSDVANVLDLTEERLEQLAANRDKAIIVHKRAQEAMIARKPGLAYKKFKVGDKVWLDARNLHLKMMHKLTPRLPENWRVHNVFHTSLLTPQEITPEYGIPPEPPLPELVDGQLEFEVESILHHKFVGRKKEIRYLVQWRGIQVHPSSVMSSVYDINTAYDSLDDSTYDIFDLDAYCNSLSPSVSTPKPVPNPSVPSHRLKHFPKTHGHPCLSPAIVSAPTVPPSVVASTPAQPATVPAKPNKGKGHQCPAPALTPTSPVDTRLSSSSSSSSSTDSVDLTPEQHLCLVRVLKRLDEWFAQGWEPGVDKSRLRALAEVFNSTESIAEGSLSNIRCADLAWRLLDSEGWEKSAGSSIMGAIDIQVTVTKILFKDYREPLIVSFRSFLGQKEAELGDSGRPSCISGSPFQKATGQGDPKPDVPKRNGMKAADYLLMRRVPAFQHMMKRAGVSLNTLPLLAERLTSSGSTSCSLSVSLPLEPTLFIPATPLVHSLMGHSPPSSSSTNYVTFSRVVDASPTPTPSEDFNAFGATPLDTGPLTMTELMEQFMEDQLTQEFCPVMLAEDS
ncbi:hypothetical protein SCLCIDRAFT_27696 [Scleroderma citrinum Foug A]|uniref:Integrase catalytic domain-containing protein n=1 Tax=Scleroderma citrinum Foug A TaxID=1036808 RepID=A0A0C3DSL7_9AGAM|nr:hypothetical protein SCLCIDRAFT_27696 [Scleroderma citrinum Foug A]